MTKVRLVSPSLSTLHGGGGEEEEGEEEEEKEEEEREKEAGVGEREDLYLRFYGVFSSAFLVEEILIGAALYNR